MNHGGIGQHADFHVRVVFVAKCAHVVDNAAKVGVECRLAVSGKRDYVERLVRFVHGFQLALQLFAYFLAGAYARFSRSLRVTPLTDKNTISLPILADVPAGLPEFSDADVETFWDIPRWVFPGADFVVKCNGDSLEPKLHQGDYCVIRKTDDPIQGRAMIVKTEKGVCMKVINKRKDGAIELRSTNPKYKPFVPEELVIIGLIIGHWSRDDKENWSGIMEGK